MHLYYKSTVRFMEVDMGNELEIFANSEQKTKYIEQFSKDAFSKRYHEEKSRPRSDGEYQRDYSRIMYASSFRRLQGKMQLLGIKPDQFFRNRLTHSLEVAQIARSIAVKAGYGPKDIYVVEAGALAHDIGNPPFGHSGEKELHKLFNSIGGFEGNAQTLRILTSIEKKNKGFQGLNLTYRSLLSVVKYFKKYKEGNAKINKKFIYDDDYNMLYDFIKEHDIKVRTFDVQIVDVADEIAYAAHDLEDGLRQKCFTIDEILHDFYKQFKDSVCYNKLETLVMESREDSGYKNNDLDSSIYSCLFRQELTSKLVNCLINDLGICAIKKEDKNKTGTLHNEELNFKTYGDIAHGLKEITFNCINHNDMVYTYERKGNIILKTLVDFYKDKNEFLPPEYRKKNYVLKENEDENMIQDRLICDYVSGMMDSYAINCYEKITGISFDKIII